MFLGINMFLALLRTHFNPRVKSGQKHIYAREHQLYCYIIVELFELKNCLKTLTLRMRVTLMIACVRLRIDNTICT